MTVKITLQVKSLDEYRRRLFDEKVRELANRELTGMEIALKVEDVEEEKFVGVMRKTLFDEHETTKPAEPEATVEIPPEQRGVDRLITAPDEKKYPACEHCGGTGTEPAKEGEEITPENVRPCETCKGLGYTLTPEQLAQECAEVEATKEYPEGMEGTGEKPKRKRRSKKDKTLADDQAEQEAIAAQEQAQAEADAAAGASEAEAEAADKDSFDRAVEEEMAAQAAAGGPEGGDDGVPF